MSASPRVPVVHVRVLVSEFRLERVCPRCDVRRSHVFTWRSRLNANGRALDAWLLFACSECSRTLKLPVLERVPVRSVAPDLLRALEVSDPVRLGSLVAEQVTSPDFTVDVEGADVLLAEGGWVVLSVAPGVRARLDRVLAVVLGVPRARVKGRIVGRANRPVRDGQRIEIRPGPG